MAQPLIRLSIDDRDLRRSFRRLADREMPRVAAAALNKTAFDVLDAEKAHAKSVFEFAGSATERFLSGAGSFGFEKATPSKLVVSIGPAKKAEQILAPHQAGSTLTPASPKRLVIEGQLATPVTEGGRIAPAGARVTARGRVRKGRRGKRFIVGRAVLERTRAGVKLIFALSPRFQLKPRFEFYRVAEQTARLVFSDKLRREIARLGDVTR